MDSIRNITAFATLLRPLRCCSQTDCLTLTLFSHTHTRVHNSTQHNPPLLHRQVTASSNQPYGERGSSLLFAVVSPASSILAVFMCTRSRGTSVVTTSTAYFPTIRFSCASSSFGVYWGSDRVPHCHTGPRTSSP